MTLALRMPCLSATSACTIQLNAALTQRVSHISKRLQYNNAFVLSRRTPCKRNQRQVGPVWAQWGAEVQFSSARVLESDLVGENLQRVLVDIGPAAASYTKAGQFIQAKIADSKPGFFALASPPDSNNAGVVELLIKNAGGTAELLCAAKQGSEVEVSSPMGKGFPVDRIPPQEYPTVILFAAGSGISPIKALIESGALNAGQRKDVRLYYGAFNPKCMAYQDRFSSWEKEHGIKVIPVYSDDGAGYVQDAFARDGGVVDAKGVATVLCGHKDMCQTITEMFTSAGVSNDAVLLNF